jgi:hypothetical protein
MSTPVFHQQPIIQSGVMEGASTITLNSFNSLATMNGNDMYPIFNFGGKNY